MSLVYGIICDGTLYSERIARRLCGKVPNGVYSMDMSVDDFTSTIAPADMADATRFFKRSSRMGVVRGISFGSGFVPANPVAFPQVPIGVVDPTYDDLEEIEVARFGKDGLFYFMQSVESANAYLLADMRASLASDHPEMTFKGASPEMRIAYSLLLAEKKRKAMAEPVVALKAMMEEVGATVSLVKVTNRGFEVSWGFEKHKIVTMFDKELRVVHAGYCVNNNDRILSARSIVNTMKDGIEGGGHIHTTVAYDHEDFDRDDRDEE